MTHEDSNERSNWLASGLAFVLRRVRPPLHLAVFVLYGGLSATLIAWVSVLIYLLFGEPRTVDYLLLGMFVGPLGVGALAVALYDVSYGDRANPWIGSGLFGAVTGYAFWVLAEMQLRENIDYDTGVLVAIGLALLFVLLRWLLVKEQKSHGG